MSKLYTEEQVRILLKDLLGLDKSVNEAIDSLEPIELPTDGEAYQEVKHRDLYESSTFILGVQWMRDKIQGGNNE